MRRSLRINANMYVYRNIYVYWLEATYLIREHIYHIGNEFFHVKNDVCVCVLCVVFHIHLFRLTGTHVHTYIAYRRTQNITHRH